MNRGAFLKRLAGAFGLTLSGGLTEKTEKLVGVCPKCSGRGRVIQMGPNERKGPSDLPDDGGWEAVDMPCPVCQKEEYLKAMKAWYGPKPTTANEHYEAYTRFCAEPFLPEFERARDEADAAIRKHIEEHLKAIRGE